MFILLLHFHIHKNFNGTLDVVDQSKPVEVAHLLLLLLEEVFVVVVDFFVRPNLHRQVQLENSLFERLVTELKFAALLQDLVMGKQIKVPSVLVVPTLAKCRVRNGFQTAERVSNLGHDGVARPVCIVEVPQ